jgi:hypothetical protein
MPSGLVGLQAHSLSAGLAKSKSYGRKASDGTTPSQGECGGVLVGDLFY